MSIAHTLQSLSKLMKAIELQNNMGYL